MANSLKQLLILRLVVERSVFLDVQKHVNSRLQQNVEAEKKAGEEKLKREVGALKEQLQVRGFIHEYSLIFLLFCCAVVALMLCISGSYVIFPSQLEKSKKILALVDLLSC